MKDEHLNSFCKFLKSQFKVIVACAVTAGAVLVLQSDPLEPVELTKYRVVYDTGSNIGRSCGEDNYTGWAWYGEVLDEGIIFDTWVKSGQCSLVSEKDAIEWVEENLSKKLETKASQSRVFQAYIGKEDVVKFEPVKKEIE